jgi:hypothetical protein
MRDTDQLVHQWQVRDLQTFGESLVAEFGERVAEGKRT